MTALSPGPWLYEEDGCVGARGNVSDAHGHIMADIWSDHADGRAMAAAPEALAILNELAKPEDELRKEYEAATGEAVPKVEVYSPAWAHYYHWVWLRNDVLRNKAEKVLEKAGVKP